MKNNYASKMVRTLNSVKAIDASRKGLCKRCGECCKLPNRCIFLDYVGNKSICKIYKFRPLNCRKYPRTVKEHITTETCGYYFEDGKI